MSNANSPSTESLYDDSDELESLNAAEVAALLLPPRSLSTNSPSAVVPSTSDVSMGSADSVGVQTNVQQSTSNESTKQQNPASSEIIANDSATASSDLKTPSLVESLSTTSISASTELSNETDSATEFFKVPLPPPAAAQSLHGLPADIEHIIAMGANAPDESEPVPTSNYEKVVKNLREKAGFASSANAHSTAVLAGDGLASIEQEMLVGGVPRQEANIEMANGDADGAAWSSTRDVAMEESADSSDASSSDASDSEAESVSVDVTASASTAPKSKKAQAKANRKKKAASDDDLSDDDVNTSSVAPKTEHEVALPVVEPPKLTAIPDSEEIVKFGTIASIIDTVVVVKADTAGDLRVLDEGSLCCWEDRAVIGNIFETFGSVQSPFYSVRFPTSAALDPLVYTIGKAVFYAPKMSSFVFTRDIRALKGSDASNVWDEEVGAAEMEWSDDEQEQEYKRNAKNDRRARSASLAPSSASRQGSRAPSVGPSASKSNPQSNLPPRPSASARQPYDSDTYVPLERPRDLHLMGNAPPSAREGRQMFERDNGGRLGGGEMGVEYDFSDDDETGSISSTFEVDERYREIDEMARVERENAASRGGARGGARGGMTRGNDDRGARGRGGFEGRGRGRGNSDDRGKGRGRGRGDGNMRGGGSDRGRGGERNGPPNGSPRQEESPRQVAPLPRPRYSGPPAPGFNGPPPPPSAGYSPSRPHQNAPHPNSNPSQMQYPHYPQQLQPQYSPHRPHPQSQYPTPPPHTQPPPFAFNPMAAMGGFNSYPQQRQPLYQNQSRSFNTAGAPVPSANAAQQSPSAPQYPANQFGFQPSQYMPFAPQMMGFPGFMGQQYSPGGVGGSPGQFQQQQNVWRNQISSQGPAGQGGAGGGAQEGRPTVNPNAYWPAGQNGESRGK